MTSCNSEKTQKLASHGEERKKVESKTKKSPEKMSEIDEHICRRYDIKKRLGKGAYGIVWKAVDKKSKEVVAVKKIFDAFRNQTDAQRTFREIIFLQSFRNHPNIIKLHSVHRAHNNRDIYLGFEYMDMDLHNVIKRGNILKDIHKRYIMYQMLRATKYIHSGNVIHRDQKPSNVLIDSACRVKIADFGLARSVSGLSAASGSGVDGCGDACLTDYVATRWYRAPEILVASKRYTKGIDMWSLGCILGEMLTGKALFPGSSTVNQLERIMAAIPSPSKEDISSVCTGYGSALITNNNNWSDRSEHNFLSLSSMLSSGPSDAVDLVKKLLVFNPQKRLSAVQALQHEYVAKFHREKDEPFLKFDIIPPLNDDLQLSVDDYRNKLYGLMESSVNNNCTNGVSASARTYDRRNIPHSNKPQKSKTLEVVNVNGASRRHSLGALPPNRYGLSNLPQSVATTHPAKYDNSNTNSTVAGSNSSQPIAPRAIRGARSMCSNNQIPNTVLTNCKARITRTSKQDKSIGISHTLPTSQSNHPNQQYIVRSEVKTNGEHRLNKYSGGSCDVYESYYRKCTTNCQKEGGHTNGVAKTLPHRKREENIKDADTHARQSSHKVYGISKMSSIIR